ncbi:intraflagellar transport 20 isoform X1 [Rhipicephalus microplus]|uniref:intraflagellar transport 20 isoform X1 n=1 Tax=Rhipicephalus microplus TaxID=6941 RepID=UPI003F6D9E2E
MANEVFSRAGLYVDELNKLRIADPDAIRETQELKDDCHKFIERMTEFQSVVDKYIAISDKLAAEVEHEKLKVSSQENLHRFSFFYGVVITTTTMTEQRSGHRISKPAEVCRERPRNTTAAAPSARAREEDRAGKIENTAECIEERGS